MASDAEFSFLFLYAIFLTARANIDPFSDDTRFMIQFPGNLPKGDDHQDDDVTHLSASDYLQDEDSLVIVTAANEKYKCVIPPVTNGLHGLPDGTVYDGPSEVELLAPLFQQSSCSYKIEPYWTYELCHNKYIKQYHEERESDKETKLQEYYLGYYRGKENIRSPESNAAEQDIKKTIKTKSIGGKDLAYYSVGYIDGTECDLNRTPRKTQVLYICHELGRGEIYELKETSSCEYEITILTQLLCSHPDYTAHKDTLNLISCHSIEDSARRPHSLANFELENSQARYNRAQDQLYPKTDIQNPPETHTTIKYKPQTTSKTPETSLKGDNDALTSTDKKLLKDFLSGEYCIQGGGGWWKHEFCYGKKITQFHEDITGKTVVVLGEWNEEAHREWMARNQAKRPKHTSTNQVVHQYYGGGDVCDLTDRKRFVEVKLRCRGNPSNPHSVSIYLLETRTCEYNLVVESPIFCSILEKADSDGVIIDPET